MREKTEVEMARARALKAYRSAIRLRYSLLADEEINRTLPQVEKAFEEAVAAGRPYLLDVSSAFEELE